MIDSIHKATNKIFKDIFKSNMSQLLHSYFVPVSVCCSRQTCANCCIPICPGLSVLFSANMCQLLHSYFVPVSVYYSQQTCVNCCIPICPGLSVLFSSNMCQLLHSYLSRSQCVILSKHVPIAAFLFVPVSVCYSQQTCANCCIPICPGLSVLFSANMCQLLHSYLSRSQCVILSKHVPIAAFQFVPVSVCCSPQTCANCCIPICPGLSVLFSANMCQLLHSYLSRSQCVILSKHVPIAAFLFVPVSGCYSQQTCANCCTRICLGLSVLFSSNMCQLLHSYFVSVSVCYCPQTCANCCIPILSQSQCVILSKYVSITAFLFSSCTQFGRNKYTHTKAWMLEIDRTRFDNFPFVWMFCLFRVFCDPIGIPQ